MSKNSKRSNNSRRREFDTTALANFLSALNIGVKPSFHVNGPQFLSAVLTVDLGQPLKQVRLTSEQDQELKSLMRSLTLDILGRDKQVTVQSDNYHGIMWANAN